MIEKTNIFDGVPDRSADEIVTELLSHSGTRIERIVSTGQATQPDAPYDQDHDEWVLLLTGAAGLWIEGEDDITLRPGDCLTIRARQRHRVTWTAVDQPTIWFAIHFPKPER
jgi:cupin 2 domain-containing protein